MIIATVFNTETGKYSTFVDGERVEDPTTISCGGLTVGSIIEEDEWGTTEVAIAAPAKKLNKPFRTPSGPKKFAVYVKNDKGNTVLVRFGDPNMSIKRDDPDRRRSFRARHNCDDPGPKWKARYWSCRFWSTKPVSDLT